MSFKLLAIRATGRFPYLKNLQQNYLYCFTSDYTFTGNNDKDGTYENIKVIDNKQTYPSDLYDLRMANRRKLSVNISAVLGKNGSGKSSLLELLYLQIYCLAELKGYLKEREYNERHVDRGFNQRYFNNTYRKQVEKLLGETSLESYYEIDGKHYVLVQAHGEYQIYLLKKKTWIKSEYISLDFFYSIVVNYSLYGLNDSGEYFWLHPLFHKNDGYKTPLVLNPYRDSGKIDVNSELHLAQTRVLTNMVDERFKTGEIIDNKTIKSVTFSISPEKIGWVNGLTTGEILELTYEGGGGDLRQVFEEFIKAYTSITPERLKTLIDHSLNNLRNSVYGDKVRPEELSTNIKRVPNYTILELLAEYILTKIAKICSRYDEFVPFTKEVLKPGLEKTYLRVISNDKEVIDRLLANSSHVTLKLKQAANAYVYHYFQEVEWRAIVNKDDTEQRIYQCELSVRRLSKMINDAIGDRKNVGIYFIPAAMFRPSLELKTLSGTSLFPQMSSGEQQMLNSIHCILYHLLNIDSLDKEVTGAYKNVNVILDEIELYYHPDYQRNFIQTLRSYLERLRLRNVRNINIVFSTHSPFILSDIPQQNVLKLENGVVAPPEMDEKTFGSNIHEMLARSFFLNNELIGEFAKNHIKKTVKLLTTANELHRIAKDVKDETATKNYSKIKQKERLTGVLMKRIELVGERVIYLKLKEMHRDIFETEKKDKEDARRKIQALMSQYSLEKTDI